MEIVIILAVAVVLFGGFCRSSTNGGICITKETGDEKPQD